MFIFGYNKNKMVDGYFFYVWVFGGGQYGFNNYWVVCKGDEVFGVVICWYSKLGVVFDRVMFDSIMFYFIFDEVMMVLMCN